MVARLGSMSSAALLMALGGCADDVHELTPHEEASGARKITVLEDGREVERDPVAYLMELEHRFVRAAQDCNDGTAGNLAAERQRTWAFLTYGQGRDGSEWRVVHGEEGCHAEMASNFLDSLGNEWVLTQPEAKETPEVPTLSSSDAMADLQRNCAPVQKPE